MTYKKINKEETIFHIFEINPQKFSMFDSELDEAIWFGSWNIILPIIKNIKKANPNVIFYFYAKDSKQKMVLDQNWTNTLSRKITGV